MWQHAELSEQIRPSDTLACRWDVKQPTKQKPTTLTVGIWQSRHFSADFQSLVRLDRVATPGFPALETDATPQGHRSGFMVPGFIVTGFHVTGLHFTGFCITGLHVTGFRVTGLHVTGLHVTRLRGSRDLAGPVVRCPPHSSRPGFQSRLIRGAFSRSSHTGDLPLVLQGIPCQVPGGIGSALGLVGSVSVYCGWVRWKV